MAKTEHHYAMSYRLFATLLMFVTFIMGGLIGYYTGFSTGEEHARTLLYEGRQSEQTTVTGQDAAATMTTCQKEQLGASRYEATIEGSAVLTTAEIMKLLNCAR